MDENYTKIYQEDCNSVRYQNDLMWNRFKTAATIEGLVLFGLYQLPKALSSWEYRCLMMAGFLLVFIIFLVALRDSAVRDFHYQRVRKFEKEKNYYEIEFKHSKWLNGRLLMRIAMLIIILSNILILFDKW